MEFGGRWGIISKLSSVICHNRMLSGNNMALCGNNMALRGNNMALSVDNMPLSGYDSCSSDH